jgi:hypothetical protein
MCCLWRPDEAAIQAGTCRIPPGLHDGGTAVADVGMRALYFLLAGAVKLLTGDLYEIPTWASPAFIAAVLAVVAALSVRDTHRRGTDGGPSGQARTRPAEKPQTGVASGSARLRSSPEGELHEERSCCLQRGHRAAVPQECLRPGAGRPP